MTTTTDSGAEAGATLRRLIAERGPIGIDTWMAVCNGAYYARGDAIGTDGDFITAPECTQIFGELIGLWAAVVWQGMGGPSSLRLVELGPGRGTLMRDILRAAAVVPGFRDALDVHLVETSPALRARQQAALDTCGVPVAWSDTVNEVPDGPAIFIGNEFLDALPIRQFVRRGDGWAERRIGLAPQGDGFAFVLLPVDKTDLPELAPAHRAARPGAMVEVSTAMADVVRHLAQRLQRIPGAALFIDYGPRQSAVGDSFQAVRRHRFASPLETPGTVDLTAHVDFERLAAVAGASGAVAEPIIEQSRFLCALGLEERARRLLTGARTEAVRQALVQAVRRLTHPDEMGTLFKVLGVRSPRLPPLPGFER